MSVEGHRNTQGEYISIEPAGGEFVGCKILVIHDDGPLFTKAPMLLDEGTREWLHRMTAPEAGEF